MSEKQAFDTDTITEVENPYSLVVWNDEVNSFDWVIQTLIEVCKHSTEQAEQCAMIIHTQGKYAVKQGSYEELKPMCDAITDRGIGATIEVLSNS
ncbi:MAG TPA: Clp protease ClpS [Chitinophagaceae bacterium]|nr:Clp protease ClpS [Chitinophagaceae bacterium]